MKEILGSRSEIKILKHKQDLFTEFNNDVYVYSEGDAEDLDEFNMRDNDCGIRVRTIESNLLKRSAAKGDYIQYQ